MRDEKNLIARPNAVGNMPRWVNDIGYGQRNLAGAAIGAINWTTIFTSLIQQGFSTYAAQKEADRRYALALAEAQKAAAGGSTTTDDDKTKMYLLIGGAVAIALILYMK